MDASVILCTYNRCYNLPDCLAALEQQEDCGLTWEVVLVDNNSSDHTRAWVSEYASQSQLKLRYTFCPEQGLSHARNHGIQTAQGQYLVFIDDDIRVSRRWLAAIVETFKSYHCDAVGGPIHLSVPLAELPGWITSHPEMPGFLGFRDFGAHPCRLDGIRAFPFGGNMAIQKSVFARLGGFDPRLGRKGEGRRREELFKGEETEFFQRLAQAGGVIWYQPQALVYHLVTPRQLKRRYFLTLHYNAGRQQVRLDRRDFPRKLLGVPRFLYLHWLHAIWRYLKQTAREGLDRSFRQLMNVAYLTGMIQEYFRRGSA